MNQNTILKWMSMMWLLKNINIIDSKINEKEAKNSENNDDIHISWLCKGKWLYTFWIHLINEMKFFIWLKINIIKIIEMKRK